MALEATVTHGRRVAVTVDGRTVATLDVEQWGGSEYVSVRVRGYGAETEVTVEA